MLTDNSGRKGSRQTYHPFSRQLPGGGTTHASRCEIHAAKRAAHNSITSDWLVRIVAISAASTAAVTGGSVRLNMGLFRKSKRVRIFLHFHDQVTLKIFAPNFVNISLFCLFGDICVDSIFRNRVHCLQRGIPKSCHQNIKHSIPPLPKKVSPKNFGGTGTHGNFSFTPPSGQLPGG